MGDALPARGQVPHRPADPADPTDPGRARLTVAAAIAGLRPIATQSHDGLTLVLLGAGRGEPGGTHRAASGTALDDPVAAVFALPPGVTGVAVGVFDRIVSLHAFDGHDALAAAWDDLVACAVEAWRAERDAVAAGSTPPPGRRSPDDGAAVRLLRRAAIALDGATIAPRLGATPGSEVRIVGERVQGVARVADGRAVQLALLPREPDDPSDGLVP